MQLKSENYIISMLALFMTVRLLMQPEVSIIRLIPPVILLVTSIVYPIFKKYCENIEITLPPLDYEKDLQESTDIMGKQVSTSDGSPVYRRIDHLDNLEEAIYSDRPDILTIPDELEEAANRFGDLTVMGVRDVLPNGSYGEYKWITYREMVDLYTQFGIGLRMKFPFLKYQDPICVFGKNSKELELGIFAAFSQALMVIPLYDSYRLKDLYFVLKHSQVKVVLTNYEKISSLLESLDKDTAVEHIILFGEKLFELPKKEGINYYNYEDILEAGKLENNKTDSNFINWKPKPDDVSYILYTSGTTGNPKGAMLTHRGMIASGKSLLDSAGPIIEGDTYLSFLPLAHAFETTVHLAGLSVGGRVGYYTGDFKRVRNDLAALKPTVLCGVPRVFEQIYQNIIAEINTKPFFLRPLIAHAFKQQTLASREGKRIAIWDKLVFKKIQQAVGGRVRLMCVGSAALSSNIKEFMHVCMNAPMVEGYGLTECHAIALVTKNGHEYPYGHTGAPVCDCEIKLRSIPELDYSINDKPYPRGEVMIKGCNVFKGYYKDEESTKNQIDENGWLHSGDVGRWNNNGTVTIIDRIGNIVKLSQGEYVCVETVESIYKCYEIISQIYIYGNAKHRFLIAIICPNKDQLIEFAKVNKFNTFDFDELCENKEMIKLLLKELDQFGRSKGLLGYEIIKNIYLESYEDGFTVDNGLITPTFKLKRKELKARYGDVIEKLYEEL